MYTFTKIWLGQLVSAIGSQMTLFALTIWTWEQTGSATALALIGFFALLSGIVTTPFLGAIVDRHSRKQLMLLSDTMVALAVSAVLILNSTNSLQVWHLYAIATFIGPFAQLQGLAYQASLALIVPERHYTRVSSMGMMIFYGSQILSPAFAGVLYPVTGLDGIVLIDLATFAIALLTLLAVQIPQPHRDAEEKHHVELEQPFRAGVRYILANRNLLALLIITCSFWFMHELADTLVNPLILARTNGNAAVLGSVSSAVGLGGVIGAITLSVWGGPKRRVKGLSVGIIGVGISRALFGVGQSPIIWLPSQFCSSLQFPLFGSSEQALWLTQIQPSLQGRIFAVQSLSQQVAIALAILIAGPLADFVFEPAMMPDGKLLPLLGGIFGVGTGTGTAVLFELCACCMILIGIGSLTLYPLEDIENHQAGKQ
ncbi:MAG: MFS transporter [Microcoleus sp. SIO2G3]|nr:MFS transporter [Microcoleus sp. SIO2G3]